MGVFGYMVVVFGFGEVVVGLRFFGEVDINLCDFVYVVFYFKFMILYGCCLEEGKYKSKVVKIWSCCFGVEVGGIVGCFRVVYFFRLDC